MVTEKGQAGQLDRGTKEVALLVRLMVGRNRREEFEAYERAAAAILSDYGGLIVLAFRPEGEPDVEWHVVTFPDAAAFSAYRQDERVAGLKEQRDAVITATNISVGQFRLRPYTNEE